MDLVNVKMKSFACCMNTILLFTGQIRSQELFRTSLKRMKENGVIKMFDHIVFSSWPSHIINNQEFLSTLVNSIFSIVLVSLHGKDQQNQERQQLYFLQAMSWHPHSAHCIMMISLLDPGQI